MPTTDIEFTVRRYVNDRWINLPNGLFHSFPSSPSLIDLETSPPIGTPYPDADNNEYIMAPLDRGSSIFFESVSPILAPEPEEGFISFIGRGNRSILARDWYKVVEIKSKPLHTQVEIRLANGHMLTAWLGSNVTYDLRVT